MLWVLPVLRSISRFCSAGTASITGSISSVDTARTALAVPKHSQYLQYARSMKYSSTICALTLSIIPCPVFSRNHSQMVPRVGVGTNFFRWGHLEYLILAKFRDCILLSTRSISRFCAGDIACTPKYFGVRNCGYCLYSVFCTTAHTPSARSIWAFCTARTLQYSQLLGLQYSNTLSTREYNMYSTVRVYSEYQVRWERFKRRTDTSRSTVVI